MANKEIPEYITFPRTFEEYRWYKPILVFIIGLIIFIIFSALLDAIFSAIYGESLVASIVNGGYEVLNNNIGEIYTDLGVIIMIPSLYLATKIVKDRPFSSYSSSRGGWNYRLYFKALIIPLLAILTFNLIGIALGGTDGTYHFSVVFLIISLILVPLQCIAEEYIYRGLVMQTFGSWFKIPVLAIILQTVIFAVSHGYNDAGLISVFVSGLIYGFFTWKTNGIEVSSALHTANNLTVSISVMFGLQSTSSTIGWTDMAIAIALDIAICLIMYYIGKKTDWFGEIKENSKIS